MNRIRGSSIKVDHNENLWKISEEGMEETEQVEEKDESQVIRSSLIESFHFLYSSHKFLFLLL